MAFEKELQAALDAAHQAGRIIFELYARFVAIPDAPAEISTEADKRAQEAILAYLHERFPTDAYGAEEQSPLLAGCPASGPRLWIIDPIDGSRGFAKKNGEFSVMIGFVHEGRSSVGVVLEPANHRLTYAVQGGGCWVQDGGASQPSRCHVSPTADLAKASLTQSLSKNKDVPSRQVQALKPVRVKETYSAGIKMALVARGEVDVYANLYEAFHDWDICAGHVLVEEAGGKVTGLKGDAIHYGSPGFWQRQYMLATNGLLHQAAVKCFA